MKKETVIQNEIDHVENMIKKLKGSKNQSLISKFEDRKKELQKFLKDIKK